MNRILTLIITMFFMSIVLSASAQATYDQLLNQIRHDLGASVVQTNIIVNIDQTTKSLFPFAWGRWPFYVSVGIASLFWIIFLFGSFFTVSTQQVAIVERFGKFQRKCSAGLRFKFPFIDSVVDRLSLMQEQHGVELASITKDKVAVKVCATIQYKVIEGREFDAYYLLDDPTEQIETFFFDIMRAQVPVLTLDQLYESKDSISLSATTELEKDMTQFAYKVPRVLITAIEPDAKVKAAMNEINAAQRESEAAKARGEAEKIVQVKKAEAQAEADKLRGIGLANQRIELTRGLQKSMEEIKTAAPKADDNQILSLLMLTQYLETIEKVSANGKSNVILMPHSPGGMNSIRDQIQEAILTTRNQ